MWAAHARPDAEPEQGLSVGRIVTAAIELADADGLGAVSMARVATRLGFTTMSLYRHVHSKDELVLHGSGSPVRPAAGRSSPPSCRAGG